MSTGETRASAAPQIESISAVTLATHDMARAVRFYSALGFSIRYGGGSAAFTSFHAGRGYLNLIAAPEDHDVFHQTSRDLGEGDHALMMPQPANPDVPAAVLPPDGVSAEHRVLISALRTPVPPENSSPGCCRSGLGPELRSYSFVMVMQATEFRDLDHPTPIRRMHRPRIRCVHR